MLAHARYERPGSWNSPLKSSAILLCYNNEAYVAEALRSVLDQDVTQPIEVIVSDDASTDSTYAIIQGQIAAYSGPHQVCVLGQATNSGSKSAHLNRVFPLASGDIFVSFDADDVAEAHRLSRIQECFQSRAEIAAVYSNVSMMDESGRSRGIGSVTCPPRGVSARRWFAQVDAYAAGSTLAVRRDVVDRFAPLDPKIHEDVVLPFRASLLGDVVFIDEPLVRYRRHEASLTADFGQFRSLEKFRGRMLEGIARARAHLVSRLDDLSTARRLMPENLEEWDSLEQVARSSLMHAEMTEPLFSRHFYERWLALVRLIAAGAYRHELAQNSAIAIAPASYLRYKRRRLSVR